MNLLYLHAAIPVGFFKVRVIISCCIFMSELLFRLCFRFCFKQNPQVFVLNKRVLWLQSRSCFTAIFGNLTLPSLSKKQGLNFAKFYYALVLFTMCFVAPEQKLFYGQFLLPDSEERLGTLIKIRTDISSHTHKPVNLLLSPLLLAPLFNPPAPYSLVQTKFIMNNDTQYGLFVLTNHYFNTSC